MAVADPALPAAQGDGEAEGEESAARLGVEQEVVREEAVRGRQAAACGNHAVQVPMHADPGHVASRGGIAQDLEVGGGGTEGTRGARGPPNTRVDSFLHRSEPPVGQSVGQTHRRAAPAAASSAVPSSSASSSALLARGCCHCTQPHCGDRGVWGCGDAELVGTEGSRAAETQGCRDVELQGAGIQDTEVQGSGAAEMQGSGAGRDPGMQGHGGTEVTGMQESKAGAAGTQGWKGPRDAWGAGIQDTEMQGSGAAGVQS